MSKPRALYFKDHELVFLKYVLEEKVSGYNGFEKEMLREPLIKIRNEILRRENEKE